MWKSPSWDSLLSLWYIELGTIKAFSNFSTISPKYLLITLICTPPHILFSLRNYYGLTCTITSKHSHNDDLQNVPKNLL